MSLHTEQPTCLAEPTPVRDLLSDPKRWTKQVYARDANGETCSVHSERAVSWCLVGAVQKCYPPTVDERGVAWKRLSEALGLDLGGTFALELFNNRVEHPELMELVTRAGI